MTKKADRASKLELCLKNRGAISIMSGVSRSRFSDVGDYGTVKANDSAIAKVQSLANMPTS